jgi:proline iminopeptidase
MYYKNPYMKKILLSFLILHFAFHLSAQQKSALNAGDHIEKINGFLANYYVSGHGPVCIFMAPGWGPDVEIYKETFKPLEKYFTMVYFNTRGTGKSEAPADSNIYSYYFMKDLDALRNYLGQPKIWLIGHSASGTEVIRYACLYNDKLNGVISIAPYWGNIEKPDPPDSIYNNYFMTDLNKRKNAGFFEKGKAVLLGMDTTVTSINETMSFILPFYFHDTLKLKDFYAIMARSQTKLDERPMAHDKKVYAAGIKYDDSLDFKNIKQVTAPVLLIDGDDDFVCDPAICARRIQNLINGSESKNIKNAGHFPWVELPDSFWKDVEQYLAEHKVKKNTGN